MSEFLQGGKPPLILASSSKVRSAFCSKRQASPSPSNRLVSTSTHHAPGDRQHWSVGAPQDIGEVARPRQG